MSGFGYPVLTTAVVAILAVIPYDDEIDSSPMPPPLSIRSDSISCGPIALTVLLRLAGESISFEEVDRRFGGGVQTEHSMAELVCISNILGHRLQGIYLKSSDFVPHRPFIAHLKSMNSGHYVVVRPMQRASRYVQIIDPVFGNEIVKFEELIQRREWSGYVLIQ